MYNTVQPRVFVFVFVFSLARYCTAQCTQGTNYKALVQPGNAMVKYHHHPLLLPTAFKKRYIHLDIS